MYGVLLPGVNFIYLYTQYTDMTQGGLLEADYSDRELQAAHEASKNRSEKLHQKALNFIKKICPFGK